MNRTLSIITYHYVRELKHSRFPEIKGLPTEQFREQVGYIKKYYNVISGDDLLGAIQAEAPLPPRAAMLTFDDGYLDHFTQVFPILDRAGLSGCFFPSAMCVLDNRVLNVNKIQFVLAAVPDKPCLVGSIFEMLNEYREPYQLQSDEYYWDKLAKPSRFDPAEIIFIKRMLQRELPEALRTMMTDTLFQKYVTADEVSFAKELYMSVEQLQCLRHHGMYLGSHGYNHYWLDSLDQPAQEQEIDRSLAFLTSLLGTQEAWMICYPHGAYNDSLLSVLDSRGCKAGLTTRPGLAHLKNGHCLALPRLDTNDLPKQAEAPPNSWTLQVL